MIALGIDLGSSSVKVALYDGDSKVVIGSASSPETELEIVAPRPGWAEQDPETWWIHTVKACDILRQSYPQAWRSVSTIGIAYQMHGLVPLDATLKPVRPAIIWCDSRAVEVGKETSKKIGEPTLLQHNLNTLGNFTLSKLVWMKHHEPENWKKLRYAILPGDYLAYKLTDTLTTSQTGLSEMILWNYVSGKLDQPLLDQLEISSSWFPEVLPSMGHTLKISPQLAQALGLREDIELSYRAGDQPNNAFGLGVNSPGQVAVNAGTSGVVYVVTEKQLYDPQEAFNAFLHVTHTPATPRTGLLLCINGCGIVYHKLRQLFGESDYDRMNQLAQNVAPGSEDLTLLPFGNGAERVLGNRVIGGQIAAWDFNRHTKGHFYRAAIEGVAAVMAYGIQKMRNAGVSVEVAHAGDANLFKSPVFREAFVNLSAVDLVLYPQDGAVAAAKGALMGVGFWKNVKEMDEGLTPTLTEHVNAELKEAYSPFKEKMFRSLNELIK
jgi:xylulokinase